MAETTAIEWADATVNFWIGCTEISAACDFCYARDLAAFHGWAKWGAGEPRYLTKGAHKQALALERRAVREGRRIKVFSNSLSDFFDAEVPGNYRIDAWNTIDRCRNLDWLLLTKRHAIVRRHLPGPARDWPHVRIGMTVEDDKMARLRLPQLAVLGHAGWKTFVSYEPALGPVDWWPWMDPEGIAHCIGWLIAGGESGSKARPAHPDWFRGARDACARAGVPFLFKQWGEWLPDFETPAVLRDDDPEQSRFDTCVWNPEAGRWDRTNGCWTDSEQWATATDYWQPEQPMTRLGKKAAGRLLEGVEHNGFPETPHA